MALLFVNKGAGRVGAVGFAFLVIPLLAIMLLLPEAPRAAAAVNIPEGIWVIDARAGVQIFNCNGLLCGRIAWLLNPRDSAGQPDRDKKNPNPILQPRLLCGETILWGLRPVSPDHWKNGWFYNPDDGKTYSVNAELRSNDTIVARIYSGIPLFGKTKTLLRRPGLGSEGRC